MPHSPEALRQMRAEFRDRGYIALTLRRRPGDAARLRLLADMAQAARIPTVATGDVLYHVQQRRVLQDVLTCIREGCTIDQAGFRRERSFDRVPEISRGNGATLCAPSRSRRPILGDRRAVPDFRLRISATSIRRKSKTPR